MLAGLRGEGVPGNGVPGTVLCCGELPSFLEYRIALWVAFSGDLALFLFSPPPPYLFLVASIERFVNVYGLNLKFVTV